VLRHDRFPARPVILLPGALRIESSSLSAVTKALSEKSGRGRWISRCAGSRRYSLLDRLLKSHMPKSNACSI
jgi:hypothetical protein